MASKQTEYYQLCLWDEDDSFLRQEFNEDNLKVDGALGELAARTTYVPLLDVTTKAQAGQVDLDVSGIDFTKWKKVVVEYDHENDGAAGGTGSRIYVRLNGQAGTVYAPYSTGGYNAVSAATRNYLVMAEFCYTSGPRSIRAALFPVAACAMRAELDAVVVPAGQDSFYHNAETGFTNAVSPAALNKIDLVGAIPPGTRLRIWGVN